MVNNKFRYYVEDYDGDPENSYKCETYWPLSDDGISWVAEEAASDFHSYHDGWESTWPLTFVILDINLKELGRFKVDREAVPHFNASKIE